MDGRVTGLADSRLETYRTNSRRIPSVAGRVIPEPMYTRESYEREILGRIYRDLDPHDPEHVLQHEFANARGAIARFDRYAIEIRVLDVQECPEADLAIAGAITSVIGLLVEGAAVSIDAQKTWPVERLEAIFLDVIRDGDLAKILDRDYLDLFGLGLLQATARDLWRHVLERSERGPLPMARCFEPPISLILDRGTLSRRITSATGTHPSRTALEAVYRELAACLESGRMFQA